MVKVSFVVDGKTVVVEGAAGQTVMQVAVQHEVPRIEGECGGELSCATCHVWVAESQGFQARSQDEEELLELVDDVTEASRLSCQLRLADTMGAIAVTVP